MVTQPSMCLRLSDNTAGAITWWRRLPEKFCRNPIEGTMILRRVNIMSQRVTVRFTTHDFC